MPTCTQCGRKRPSSKFYAVQVTPKHPLCVSCLETPSNKRWRTSASFVPHCHIIERAVPLKHKKEKPMKAKSEMKPNAHKAELEALFAVRPQPLPDALKPVVLEAPAPKPILTSTLSPAALAASKLKHDVEQVMLTAYPEAGAGYAHPWDDATVAKVAQVPTSFVAAIRQKQYGAVRKVDGEAALSNLWSVAKEIDVELMRHYGDMTKLKNRLAEAMRGVDDARG